GGKQQMRAEWDRFAVQRYFAAASRRGRGEPAALVEFFVIRNKRLRHETEDPAPVNDGRAVEELVVHRQGQANDRQTGIDRAAFLDDLRQGFQGAPLQGRVMEQIGASVAGNAELGKG